MEEINEGFEYVIGSGFQRKKRVSSANTESIDFILVCPVSVLTNDYKKDLIISYVKNLESMGLTIEMDRGLDFKDLVFIKIYGNDVLEKYAEPFNIGLLCKSYDYRIKPTVPYKIMATDLTFPNPDSPIFQRAPVTCGGDRPIQIVRSERIQIVHALLMRIRFGDKVKEYGLKNLVKKGLLVTYYPLHDESWAWNDDEFQPLNDRQLLLHFWGNLKMWYKQQPLDTIQKYFGSEVAHYFAFFGFYNKMLIWATMAGLVCFFAGIFTSLIRRNEIIEEACASNLVLCPVVVSRDFSYQKLKDICTDIKLIHIFDNPFTIVFALFMCYWGTTFACSWKKLNSLLMYRWNVNFKDTYEIRPEYEEQTPFRRLCRFTHEVESYVPRSIMLANIFVSLATCLILILVVLSVTTILIFMRMFIIPAFRDSKNPFLRQNFNTLSSLISSFISISFILFFRKFYLKIALWLTKRENPRTQEEFDNSYTYKAFLLAIFNHFSTITYVAFFKGNLYTHPGDDLPLYKKDQCYHGGCMLGLSLELAFLIMVRSVMGHAIGFVKPTIGRLIRNFYNYKEYHVTSTSKQWEVEYNLSPVPPYYFVKQYLQLMTQYGLVTFYVAAFPLGPLCALITNLLRIRMNAYKFLRVYRCAAHFQQARMTAFYNIMTFVTFISAATNAFVIGFTSNFVKRTVYMYKFNWDLKGYVKYVHSEFNMKDYKWPDSLADMHQNHSDVTCYYHAMRHPPNHPNKYQLTSEFWFIIVIRFIVVVLFEHVILMLKTLLAHVITTPNFVKKQPNLETVEISTELEDET